MSYNQHQYIERSTGRVRTEVLPGDSIIRLLYEETLERPQWLYDLASSARVSRALAYFNYDCFLNASLTSPRRFLRRLGVDVSECVGEEDSLNVRRKIFERQIRYWQCRPMPAAEAAVVSPADAKVLLGSLRETSNLFVKGKFFDWRELLGCDRPDWLQVFAEGDFAVFRLTPEKYHYTHVPASGKVMDVYEISGRYHSCNPAATISTINPHSKNKRSVTILQTDVEGGAGIGLVAIIEVVALMVGQIVDCYSESKYNAPCRVLPGMFLRRGQPKSLFRPGSSTVILLFQPGRTTFAPDLLINLHRPGVLSRYSQGLGQTLAETDVLVRSFIAQPHDRNLDLTEYEQ